ncbi:hypothetical protein JTB14_011134 [Gonioctena quinquepunctata]|nr:hypothetical protein JTB14_011134 [Gonioctena quinquepunctata]
MRKLTISIGLQLDPTLTLEKSVTCLRKHEELLRQKQYLHEPSVSAINENQSFKKKNETHETSKCTRCGYDWRDKLTNCPAENAKCGFCKFEGHYSKMCYRKKNPRIRMYKLWRKNTSPRMMMWHVMFMKSKQKMIIMHGHKSCE